jgi:hypothetical protein
MTGGGSVAVLGATRGSAKARLPAIAERSETHALKRRKRRFIVTGDFGVASSRGAKFSGLGFPLNHEEHNEAKGEYM